MNIAVCDTSSLIRLRKGNAIKCLAQLFDKIYIPQAVKDECKDLKTVKIINTPLFETHTVTKTLPIGLGAGEREAISLAKEKNIEVVITDDDKAFSKATQYGLFPMRSTNVLIAAKQLGIIQSVAPILDTMKSEGEGIEDYVYFKTLKDSDE